MDGEKMAMSKIEDVQNALEPYKQRYGHYLKKIRPWREFFMFTKPEGDMKARLEANLTHYQINYACIFLLQCIISIVSNPHCLVVIVVLVCLWMWFLKKNDDPNWQVTIGGMDLGKTQRWMILCALSAVAFLMSVGNLLFSCAFGTGCLVLLHGVLHPVVESTYDAASALDDAI